MKLVHGLWSRFDTEIINHHLSCDTLFRVPTHVLPYSKLQFTSTNPGTAEKTRSIIHRTTALLAAAAPQC